MNESQKITYTNNTEGKQLIILEPWGEEHWIKPGEKVEILVEHFTPNGLVEIIHELATLIVYLSEANDVSIVRCKSDRSTVASTSKPSNE